VVKAELDEWLRAPRREKVEPAVSTQVASIAVLPFLNLTGNKENEYFADGLVEGIINALTRVPSLRVIARTSAFAFRNQVQDVREIGARLGVEQVLEGSVQRSDARIRITVQLIDASTGGHLWGEHYDRRITDVFAIQDDIARSIIGRFHADPGARASVARRPTNDMEAYDLYLRGRYHLSRWTPESMARARQCLESAITRDPEFALAYDSLGELDWYGACFGLEAPRVALSRGIYAVLRALEIDPTLAESHALLGMYRKELDYNWAEVDRELQRALELSPSSPLVHLRYALCCPLPAGRMDETVAEVEFALQSDPLSLFVRWWMMGMCLCARRLEQAMAQARVMQEIDPTYFLSWVGMAWVDMAAGRLDSATTALSRARELSGGAPLTIGFLSLVLGLQGSQSEARALLAQLEEASRLTYVPATCVAWAYLGLGQVDEAFRHFDRAVDERDAFMIPIKSNPFLDPLRGDPRFHALLRKMNLA
jgi:serine/threonine-protein kinase